jgi:hypothetical protein
VNARAPKNGPGGKPVQHPKLMADARALGCNAAHLRRVLIGERESKTLTARYRHLKGEELSTREALLIADYNRRQARKAPASS